MRPQTIETLIKSSVPSTCVMGENVEIGEGCTIGHYVVIEKGVYIGDRVTIGHGCFIGEGSQIGDDGWIGNRVTLREHTWIGKRVIIESGVVLGSDGFGFSPQSDGTQYKIPQIGIVEIGDDVQIGKRTTIDRATLGKTLVGHQVKIGAQVMIGHNVEVGIGSTLESQCGISGSTRMAPNVRIGQQAGLVGHLKVGEGCIIEAYAGVTKTLPAGTHIKGLFPALSPEKFDEHQSMIHRLPEMDSWLDQVDQKTAKAVLT